MVVVHGAGDELPNMLRKSNLAKSENKTTFEKRSNKTFKDIQGVANVGQDDFRRVEFGACPCALRNPSLMGGKHHGLNAMSKGVCLVRIVGDSSRKVWMVEGIFDCDPLSGVKNK